MKKLVFLLALALPACEKKPPAPISVGGTVTVNGTPATGCMVVLHPSGEPLPKGVRPHGEVDKEGRFAIGTYAAADGAPAGEYAVTLVWPDGDPNAEGNGTPSVDRFQGKYADPGNPIAHITVQPGENSLPLTPTMP